VITKQTIFCGKSKKKIFRDSESSNFTFALNFKKAQKIFSKRSLLLKIAQIDMLESLLAKKLAG